MKKVNEYSAIELNTNCISKYADAQSFIFAEAEDEAKKMLDKQVLLKTGSKNYITSVELELRHPLRDRAGCLLKAEDLFKNYGKKSGILKIKWIDGGKLSKISWYYGCKEEQFCT